MDGSAAWAERVLEAMRHPPEKPLVILRETAPVVTASTHGWLMWLGVLALCIVVGVVLWRRGGPMGNPLYLSLAVSFVTDFIISAGGAWLTAMVATGNTTVPSMAVMIFAIVTGLVAAARRVQAILQPSPTVTTQTDTVKEPSGATRTTAVSTSAPPAAPPAAAETPASPPMEPLPHGRYELRGGKWVWVPTP